MRQNAWFDLAVIGAEPLTGMFWRFGSVDDNLPVAATV
jgi:hypothetical protein